MANIEPGWYWTAQLGEGWFGPFPNTSLMLANARLQRAKMVYSAYMSTDPDGKPRATHVIDWVMNHVTGDYEEKKRPTHEA